MDRIKIGFYRVKDDGFIFGYQVHKVMKKTAVVGTSTVQVKSGNLPFEDGADHYSYRYPIDLLTAQIKDAEFRPFKDNN